MTKSIFLSLIFHSAMIIITAMTLPFMKRSPIDLPPILSVDLIQITDTTSIPFAAKAAKTLEEIKKKEEERVVSEQAPPSEKKKEKPDRIPLPEDLNKEKKQIVKKKQNPEEVKEQIRQASEFEKKELFDPNQQKNLICIKFNFKPGGCIKSPNFWLLEFTFRFTLSRKFISKN